MEGVVVLSFGLFFAFGGVQAKTFPCSTDQLKKMKEVELDSRAAAEKLLAEMTDRIDDKDSEATRLSQNDLYKLMRARGVLTCAFNKIGKLSYWCSDNSQYSAMTMWIFARRIYLSENFWGISDGLKASVLVHEYTHKCGTSDATYFGEGQGVPRDVGGGMYYSIASTYDFWIENGFCVPEVDC